MTTVVTRAVEYPADDVTMIGHLALPAGAARRPAVLIGPEGVGLSEAERHRAEALAELGYVALAFDLHGGRCLSAALDVLRAEPRADPDRIAAIGYGTGGAIALELGRGGANLGAIGTVNALTTGRPGEAARIRCPVWTGVGSEDPIMPPAQREAFTTEMQAAGVDWRLTVYGGALHAFHQPTVDHAVVSGVGYHPRHARRAWRDIVDLLASARATAAPLPSESRRGTRRKARIRPNRGAVALTRRRGPSARRIPVCRSGQPRSDLCPGMITSAEMLGMVPPLLPTPRPGSVPVRCWRRRRWTIPARDAAEASAML